MALRRADFFAYGIHDAWQTALSDDYVVSYCVKRRAHAKIHFVPQCLVPSPAAFTWPSFFEFAIRQYRITRVCAPWLWLAALTGPFLFLFALTSSFTLALAGLFLPFPHRAGLLAGLTFWTLYTMYLLRGFLLLRAAQRLLPAHWPAIRTTTLLFTFAYPLVQFINLLALLASALGRTITWRHVTYTMFSRTRTLVHRPPAPQALSEKARACVSE